MPKRTDLKKILIIGAGPIVIGQACEFDYSGTQACQALKEEGYEVVLINSNPATIMTDPEFSDATYIEPLTLGFLEKIIQKEKPCAILPTLGGQTALNLCLEAYEKGIIEQYNLEILGAKPHVIRKAEDRDEFRKSMKNIGLDMPYSEIAHNMEQAYQAKKKIGDYPLIIRPAFTLGGSGGGIAYNDEDFERICRSGIDYSPISEILIEESILGWKEYELEVVRDKADNCIIVCSIENVDPMGVHTGDSITVAPAQTLTDKQYQKMRTASLEVMREIGVETGGSNVQWAINPQNGRMVIIEMNPRVSRSSALASKATGFPIAKIATKLALGYTLDELKNDIVRNTPACFEPSIDYVVTKIPRFTFEKFSGTDIILTTQMKSVGEVMSIGKNFKQSFQKALRSMELDYSGFGCHKKDEEYERLDDKELSTLLDKPREDRVFLIREALKRNWGIELIYEKTKIDYWFLNHFQDLVFFEKELYSYELLENLKKDKDFFRRVKHFGYSDRQIAYVLNISEKEVRDARYEIGLNPVFSLVDTCAAEFKAFTPYYYSNYGELNESKPLEKSVMIVGGGPNRIGQGIEFDYCCVHSSFALREKGYKTIMINSNPETVSTDYNISDKLYFEPLTLEDVLNVYRLENCEGVIIQFGGQTPLNLAKGLQENGVCILGTKPEKIEASENRNYFKKLIESLNIKQPQNGIAYTESDALKIAQKISYPVVVRPSYVLGGRAMVIVYNEKELKKYIAEAICIGVDKPILIDKFLEDALELDIDCLSDGVDVLVAGIMEHVERAGIHSGDSACIFPPVSINDKLQNQLKRYCSSLAISLEVKGLMNVQFAIQNEEIFIIEVNPRASRTVPYLSKSIGVPIAKIASLIMLGSTLKELNLLELPQPKYFTVKEAVLPFVRFPNVDIILSPEMKSTGEVMGTDKSSGLAFLKSQEAAFNVIPCEKSERKSIMLSVCDRDKEKILPLAQDLINLGFTIFATQGTSNFLYKNGLSVLVVCKISENNKPSTIELIKDKKIQWIINTPSGEVPTKDEITMRITATAYGVPITTTIPALKLAIQGLKEYDRQKQFNIYKLQEITKQSS